MMMVHAFRTIYRRVASAKRKKRKNDTKGKTDFIIRTSAGLKFLTAITRQDAEGATRFRHSTTGSAPILRFGDINVTKFESDGPLDFGNNFVKRSPRISV